MPIRIQNDLPAREILDRENIFVMREDQADVQEIRPLEILILNLMPLKEETELQLLRSLSNTPLQLNITFMCVSTHEAKNTPVNHLNKFYLTYDEVKNNDYDGMIITGAPVEQMEFEQVDYWEELCRIFDWADDHVTSTMHLCWGAQAALYHRYGIRKRELGYKLFGLYRTKVMNRKIPLIRGFDDTFYAPSSRWTEVRKEDILRCDDLIILAESREAGVFLVMSRNGRRIYVMGHPEYDRMTLDKEYRRDMDKGLDYVDMPKNYYPDNDVTKEPLLQWRSTANMLYSNWLNYYVYQATPYEWNKISDK
jgi:homoserine O-succinyltransferase